MYRFNLRPNQSLAVWYFSEMNAADWKLHCEHLKDLATWSGKTKQRAACVLILRGFSIPKAGERQQLAELAHAPGYDPFIAFVTPNRAAQTVLSLLNWFGKKPLYESRFFLSTDDALKWLEERRGLALPMLRKMTEDLLQEAEPKTKAHA